MSAVNPPAWSLEVEIQFYCLAPLFALGYFSLKPKWLRRALGISFIILAGILQKAFVPDLIDGRMSLSILNYVQYFIAGFMLCDLYLADWDKIPAHWAWDILSTVLWCWIFSAIGWTVHFYLPFAAMLAYLGAFKGKLFRSFFTHPLISLIGGMCYSIYLTHNLALTGTAIVLHPWLNTASSVTTIRIILAFAVSLGAALVVGLLLYIAVERPCMDKEWPSKLSRWLRHRGNQSTEIADAHLAG